MHRKIPYRSIYNVISTTVMFYVFLMTNLIFFDDKFVIITYDTIKQ